jgi:hypothetical protein
MARVPESTWLPPGRCSVFCAVRGWHQRCPTGILWQTTTHCLNPYVPIINLFHHRYGICKVPTACFLARSPRQSSCTDQWIARYNTERPHQALGYCSPWQYQQGKKKALFRLLVQLFPKRWRGCGASLSVLAPSCWLHVLPKSPIIARHGCLHDGAGYPPVGAVRRSIRRMVLHDAACFPRVPAPCHPC